MMVLSLFKGLMEQRPTMHGIAEAVCEEEGLTLAQLRGPQRARSITLPRQRAMWTMYQTGLWSNGQIARFFGKADWSVVIHGRHAHAARLRGEKYTKNRNAPHNPQGVDA